MDVWKLIAESAAERGGDIEVALLGPVPYYRDESGHLQSSIPPWVEKAANAHGFRVIASDWKRDVYVLRKVGAGNTSKTA